MSFTNAAVCYGILLGGMLFGFTIAAMLNVSKERPGESVNEDENK